mgnify:CR=1 FL=1
MSSWSKGYVGDIEYLPGFYVEQTPGHIQLACLLNGYQPPLESPSFTYCELGCGQGTTAMVIAAANPRARIVAIDFNPAQIARARREAIEAGLTNIEFFELSFEELVTRPDLIDFDIVTLHGVWSWISQNNREHIVSFLKRGVKPGGAVAVSYNAMPGWTSLLPFQRMLFEHAKLSGGRSDKKVINSLDFIELMQKTGCNVVGDTKFFDRFRPSNKVRNESDHAVYLAHEYLNENWQPLYFMDTAGMLEAAKLNFVASASMLDNFPDLMLTPDQRKVYDSYAQPDFREMLKDYFVNRPFRRDIFIKGAQKISDLRRDQLLNSYSLVLLAPQSAVKYTLGVPAGEANLPPDQYGYIYEQLANGPKSLGSLTETRNNPTAIEIAGILAGSGQAAPIIWSNVHSQEGSNLFNKKSVEKIINREASTTALAVAATGSGININAIEAVIFSLLISGVQMHELKERALHALVQGSGPLLIEGVETTDVSKISSTLEAACDWFLENTLNIWRHLSLIK